MLIDAVLLLSSTSITNVSLSFDPSYLYTINILERGFKETLKKPSFI